MGVGLGVGGEGEGGRGKAGGVGKVRRRLKRLLFSDIGT